MGNPHRYSRATATACCNNAIKIPHIPCITNICKVYGESVFPMHSIVLCFYQMCDCMYQLLDVIVGSIDTQIIVETVSPGLSGKELIVTRPALIHV